jgi:hypothetical protein
MPLGFLRQNCNIALNSALTLVELIVKILIHDSVLKKLLSTIEESIRFILY